LIKLTIGLPVDPSRTVMVRALDFSKTVKFLGMNICLLNLIVTV
jgi:hypothetical protein